MEIHENSLTTIDVNESPWISTKNNVAFNLMDIHESPWNTMNIHGPFRLGIIN